MLRLDFQKPRRVSLRRHKKEPPRLQVKGYNSPGSCKPQRLLLMVLYANLIQKSICPSKMQHNRNNSSAGSAIGRNAVFHVLQSCGEYAANAVGGVLQRICRAAARHGLAARCAAAIWRWQNACSRTAAFLAPPIPGQNKKAIPFGMTFYFGGAEGNRTPVRKQLDRTFFGHSLLFTFPYRGVNKHTRRFGRVMMHGRGNSYPPHVRHSDHTQARFVALPGRMGA